MEHLPPALPLSLKFAPPCALSACVVLMGVLVAAQVDALAPWPGAWWFDRIYPWLGAIVWSLTSLIAMLALAGTWAALRYRRDAEDRPAAPDMR